ncbi:hypothetical protein CHISP_1904 [Chitinispirillum alkaliphilum]|nr:hypothetical protein CHISP_1904 [Chitinispirillum alkaliphilum]
MKKILRIAIGILGISAALYWSVLGVEFDDVIQSIEEADKFLIGAVLLMTSLNLVIRAAVWKAIVRPMKRVSLLNAFTSYLIGVFSNLFLPFKLGDVAQGYSLGRRIEISKVSLVSAVLIQRVFEVASLMVMMLLLAMFFSLPMLFERRTMLFGITFVSGVTILVLLGKYRELVVVKSEKLLQRISPSLSVALLRWFELIIEGTKAIRNVADISRILFLSIISWVIQITMAMFMAWALDIRIDFINASIVLLVINIGLLIPIAPGNIGTFQFFSILALSWFSVAKSKALSFAILFQVLQGIPVIMGGGLSMMLEMLSEKLDVERNSKPKIDKTERAP